MQTNIPEERKSQTPRMRALIEFPEGDLTRPPIVFPQGDTEEADKILRDEILKRWASQA